MLVLVVVFFFFFKQKTAYEMLRSLVGSEMCIRDRTSSKAQAPTLAPKPKQGAKKLSHSQLVAQWESQGRDKYGKLIKFTETKKVWTKAEIDRARDEKERKERQGARAEAPLPSQDPADPEVETHGQRCDELARTRMVDLAVARQAASAMMAGEVSDSLGDALSLIHI
eukprot:TRINITY_DN32823_c0_g1_i1.p1 TRINITY_DN32823_c0_g1~~TRINITY_DN32823_c0_g1_i1.p1  ORF type:complete len:168 (+),score=68.24 TRINITY_DN32823_c0_g1_i1:65-568(+)